MKTALIIALIINLAWSWYLSNQLRKAESVNRSSQTTRREETDALNNEIRRLNDEADDLDRQLAECQTDAVGLQAELTEAMAHIDRLESALADAAVPPSPPLPLTPSPSVPVPGTVNRAEIEKRERVADLMVEIPALQSRLTEMLSRQDAVEKDWTQQTGIRTSEADKNTRRAAMRNSIANAEAVIRHSLAELYQLDPTAHSQVKK
jgi:predicted  nucleic acid-binding Zn-ribbon protein